MAVIIALIFLSAIIVLSEAQNNHNNEKDVFVYLLGFANISMDNPDMKGFQQIMISSSEDAIARIEIPYISVDEYISLNSGNGRSYSRMITTDLVTGKGDRPRNRAVRITGTNQLNVQAVKSKTATTDGFLALPITDNAKEFYTISAAPTPGEHSIFVVAALYPDTCLEAYAVNGDHYTKIRGLIQLGEFDVYQMESETTDLTGVYINASKPIAVFGGHECLEEPSFTKFCDHSIIQVPPLVDWGTNFAIAPIAGRLPKAGYSIRVLSANQGTRVQITSTGRDRTLDRGQYIHANVTDSQAITLVTCSKPCLVTQYARSGQHVDGDITTDAYMTLIVPTSNYVRSMTFSTAKFYDKEFDQSFDFIDNYVGIMAPTDLLDRVLLDNQVVSGLWTTVGKGLSTISVPMDTGFHTLYLATSDNANMMGYLYGHAIQLPSAYGFPLGYKLSGNVARGPWNSFFDTIPEVTLQDCSVDTAGIRGPDLIYYLHIDLRNRVGPSCSIKYIDRLSSRFGELHAYINKMLCNKVVCDSLSGTGLRYFTLKWIRDGVYLTGLDVDVILTTSIDDSAGAMYKCRKSVLDMIASATWWKLPERIPSCPVLDFSAITARSGGRYSDGNENRSWRGVDDNGIWSADAGPGVNGGQMRWEKCTHAFSGIPGQL